MTKKELQKELQSQITALRANVVLLAQDKVDKKDFQRYKDLDNEFTIGLMSFLGIKSEPYKIVKETLWGDEIIMTFKFSKKK